MKLFTSTVLFVSALAGSGFCFAHGPDDPSMPVVRHRHEHGHLKATSYEAVTASDFGGVAPQSDSGGSSAPTNGQRQ
jgi:hypothetical protein